MNTPEQRAEAKKLHDEGYRDGFHGRKVASKDERYMASYRRGQERRTKLATGTVDHDE